MESPKMKRRYFLASAGATGVGLISAATILTGGKTADADNREFFSTIAEEKRLKPPDKGKIPIAFPISRGVTLIDLAGPWEVFQDVHIPGRGKKMEEQMPFELFTVSDNPKMVTGSGGIKISPDYTFETAPTPKVVVVPAQEGSPQLLEWLRTVSGKTDVTMSVCTGAFQLARAGLLKGKSATTHHDFVDQLAKEFPDIDVKRGLRFVEADGISTAAGLTSGIDLALRVVERYFGRNIAQVTATYMEYQSKAWIAL
jgi:transcriptional regulator GlxA family with amidase domain